jgi:hypothetical protein
MLFLFTLVGWHCPLPLPAPLRYLVGLLPLRLGVWFALVSSGGKPEQNGNSLSGAPAATPGRQYFGLL